VKRIGVIALAVISAWSCGYALPGRGGGSLPDHIRRIGVPYFRNLSTTPEIDRLLTDAVVAELRSRRKYQIVQETAGVDAVLTGSVLSLTPTVAGMSTNGLASKYVVNVVVSAEFKDLKENKVFWSDPGIRVSDEYEVATPATVADVGTLFAQDRNALERIARNFARQLVTSIFEAF